MQNPKKQEVQRAIRQAKNMLERNTDPCESFEGVLSRKYVRALRVLVSLGNNFLARSKPAARRTLQPSQRTDRHASGIN
jgi:hypothetical protein